MQDTVNKEIWLHDYDYDYMVWYDTFVERAKVAPLSAKQRGKVKWDKRLQHSGKGRERDQLCKKVLLFMVNL